eukprot:403373459
MFQIKQEYEYKLTQEIQKTIRIQSDFLELETRNQLLIAEHNELVKANVEFFQKIQAYEEIFRNLKRNELSQQQTLCADNRSQNRNISNVTTNLSQQSNFNNNNTNNFQSSPFNNYQLSTNSQSALESQNSSVFGVQRESQSQVFDGRINQQVIASSRPQSSYKNSIQDNQQDNRSSSHQDIYVNHQNPQKSFASSVSVQNHQQNQPMSRQQQQQQQQTFNQIPNNQNLNQSFQQPQNQSFNNNQSIVSSDQRKTNSSGGGLNQNPQSQQQQFVFIDHQSVSASQVMGNQEQQVLRQQQQYTSMNTGDIQKSQQQNQQIQHQQNNHQQRQQQQQYQQHNGSSIMNISTLSQMMENRQQVNQPHNQSIVTKQTDFFDDSFQINNNQPAQVIVQPSIITKDFFDDSSIQF